jgi:hypothetical protein
MGYLLIVLATPTIVLGAMNLYQALTGRRLSKRPSVRSDAEVRRQSAIAAALLLLLGGLAVALVVTS